MIVIIGATGHGKSTLYKAIEQLTNIKCEVMTTEDLFNANREMLASQKDIIEIGEEFKTESKEIKNIHRKKGKELKSWQRNKFYQR
jgi:ABC-type phosphate/phosphonate transport system ATPase subunit